MNQGEASSEEFNDLLTCQRNPRATCCFAIKAFETSVAEEENVEDVALENETDESQIDLMDPLKKSALLKNTSLNTIVSWRRPYHFRESELHFYIVFK